MVRLRYLVLVVWFECACWFWCLWLDWLGFWWLFLFGCAVFRVYVGDYNCEYCGDLFGV